MKTSNLIATAFLADTSTEINAEVAMALGRKAAGTRISLEATEGEVGVAGECDSKTRQKPILGLVLSEKGLLGDLSLEGAKITKLVR